MNRFDAPSHFVIHDQLPALTRREPEAREPLPRGTKLVRVGDHDVPLTRGERKQVLRLLMKMKLADGSVDLQTPAGHRNRRTR